MARQPSREPMKKTRAVEEIVENGKVTGYRAGKKGFNYMIKDGDSKSAKAKAEAQLRKMLAEGVDIDDDEVGDDD